MSRRFDSLSIAAVAADLSGLPKVPRARMLAGFLRGLAGDMRQRGDSEVAIAESINAVRTAIEAATAVRRSCGATYVRKS